MIPKVALIDYGLGNLRSARMALEHIGLRVDLHSDALALRASVPEIIVLPGVGSFPKGMRNLEALSLDSAILDLVDEGVPVFGICLGMQLLFESSAENGQTRGLGLLRGHVGFLGGQGNHRKQLPPLPNIGWRETTNVVSGDGMGRFYFVHSYAIQRIENVTESVSNFGPVEFSASVFSNRIAGTQFHHEKSGPSGLVYLSEVVHKLLSHRPTTV